MKVKVKKLHEAAVVPKYAKPGDAGMDLCSVENVSLGAGQRLLVATGLALEIPPGFEGQVRPRSGNAIKMGLTVLNSPGTIDSGYRGEVKVILYNTSNQIAEIKCGDRIAQLVIAAVETADVELVEELSDTERGAGGFGSTGK